MLRNLPNSVYLFECIFYADRKLPAKLMGSKIEEFSWNYISPQISLLAAPRLITLLNYVKHVFLPQPGRLHWPNEPTVLRLNSLDLLLQSKVTFQPPPILSFELDAVSFVRIEQANGVCCFCVLKLSLCQCALHALLKALETQVPMEFVNLLNCIWGIRFGLKWKFLT